MVQINESNMIFGDFEESQIFKIEKSKLHKAKVYSYYKR